MVYFDSNNGLLGYNVNYSLNKCTIISGSLKNIQLSLEFLVLFDICVYANKLSSLC